MLYPKIIGIAGKKFAGKDTFARVIEKECRERIITRKLAFASPGHSLVKNLLVTHCGLSVAEYNKIMRTPDLKDNYRLPVLNCTMRHLLQTVLTEWGRNHIHDSVWVEVLRSKLQRLPLSFLAIVTDVRHDLEAEMLRKCGATIVHLVRVPYPYQDTHSSEKGVTPFPSDRIIENHECKKCTPKECILEVERQLAASVQELLATVLG